MDEKLNRTIFGGFFKEIFVREIDELIYPAYRIYQTRYIRKV